MRTLAVSLPIPEYLDAKRSLHQLERRGPTSGKLLGGKEIVQQNSRRG